MSSFVTTQYPHFSYGLTLTPNCQYFLNEINVLAAIGVTGAKGGRSGGGALADEVWQGEDGWRAGDVEPAAEVVPERDAELVAGLHQAEEGVAAVAAGLRAGATADFAPCHLAADVILRAVGVKRDIRPFEGAEQLDLVGVEPGEQPVEGGKW